MAACHLDGDHRDQHGPADESHLCRNPRDGRDDITRALWRGDISSFLLVGAWWAGGDDVKGPAHAPEAIRGTVHSDHWPRHGMVSPPFQRDGSGTTGGALPRFGAPHFSQASQLRGSMRTISNLENARDDFSLAANKKRCISTA